MQNRSTHTSLPPGVAHLTIRATVIGGLLAFGASAQAQLTMSFQFAADPVLTAARQQAIIDTGTGFATLFSSKFSLTGPRELVFSVTATDLPASANLASAGSELSGTGTPGFTLIEVVKTKLLTGVDHNGVTADGSVNVNFGQPWQLDKNATVTGSQFDFYSTMYHEFLHALGFASTIAQNGTSVGNNEWSSFDRFISDKTGAALIDPGTFAMGGGWAAASTGGVVNGLFFNGANAMAANGGNPVGIYSPDPWAQGSSGSHIDTDNPAYAGMMMLHATNTGPGARTLSNIEVGMMQDIGYSLAAPIPEPGTYGLMLAGLGMVGWLARRRKA